MSKTQDSKTMVGDFDKAKDAGGPVPGSDFAFVVPVKAEQEEFVEAVRHGGLTAAND